MTHDKDVVVDELMINAEQLTLDEQFNDEEPLNREQFNQDESQNNSIIDHRRINNAPMILERNLRGEIVMINRLKHYFFIKRTDAIQHRDLFAREASIIGQMQKSKYGKFDTCTFDIIDTLRGFEAININIRSKRTGDNFQLSKISKNKPEKPRATNACDLFRTTILELFREAIKSNQ